MEKVILKRGKDTAWINAKVYKKAKKFYDKIGWRLASDDDLKKLGLIEAEDKKASEEE